MQLCLRCTEMFHKYIRISYQPGRSFPNSTFDFGPRDAMLIDERTLGRWQRIWPVRVGQCGVHIYQDVPKNIVHMLVIVS